MDSAYGFSAAELIRSPTERLEAAELDNVMSHTGAGTATSLGAEDAACGIAAWAKDLASGPAAGLPRGLPASVGEPLNGRNQCVDGVGQMIEVDVRKIVGGLVIVGSRP